MTRREHEIEHPGAFFLDLAEPDALRVELEGLGVLAPGESIRSVTRAGPGNMNCVLRVHTGARSLVVKQARPWVEKYPQFPAPRERALRERDFYRLVEGTPGVADRMPRLLAADEASCLLVLEDLGPGADLTCLYADGRRIPAGDLEALADYLSTLHAMFAGVPPPLELSNRAMRALNAEHVFFLPLRPSNGLDLDRIQPGLSAATAGFRTDYALASEVARLGHEAYLADGPCLIHGDFFPGSLLESAQGPRVIDPEFAFFGRPEFDLGVFVAHLALAGQPQGDWQHFIDAYRRPHGWTEPLLWQLAGVEVVRRLLGYAQLPLVRTVEAKLELLTRARDWILKPQSLP